MKIYINLENCDIISQILSFKFPANENFNLNYDKKMGNLILKWNKNKLSFIKIDCIW